MSKVKTLYSYFQKTPAREKSSNFVGGSCKVDDNANIQSSSDVNGAVTSKSSKRKRSPVKVSSALSKKSTVSREQPADIGTLWSFVTDRTQYVGVGTARWTASSKTCRDAGTV